ncbi:MAG TPA: cytidine deaminase [bacterium]|nr:cytidine deaminase [bacterium]
MNKELIQKAVATALKARKNAYAPYSGFMVGATVITKKGRIFSGVNVENSSFGATVCAERVALFSAITAGQDDIAAVVVAASLDGHAVSPCGICRQTLADFNPAMRVILVNAESGKIEKETTIAALLPDRFTFDSPNL